MGSGCRRYSKWKEKISGFVFTCHAISKSKILASIFFGLANSFKRCCGKKTPVKRAYDRQSSRRKKCETLSFYKESMIFGEEYVFGTKPTIHTALHIERFWFFSIHFFFFQAWRQIFENGINQADLPCSQSKGENSVSWKETSNTGPIFEPRSPLTLWKPHRWRHRPHFCLSGTCTEDPEDCSPSLLLEEASREDSSGKHRAATSRPSWELCGWAPGLKLRQEL